MKRFFVGFQSALTLCLLIFSAVYLPSASAAGGGSNWPQWRGPESKGISTDKGLPSEWSPTKNIRWKTPIGGRGHSSPIVWGNRIFLTSSIEGAALAQATAPKHMLGDEEMKHPDWTGSDHSYTFKVICVDSETGKVLWEKVPYEGPVYDHRHRKNTYASPTPVTDGKYVYAFFGSEGLYCYDYSGKLVWKASLGGIPQLGMGPGSSPVIYENLVIVTCDHDLGKGSFIAALDRMTGKEVWRKPRETRATWATPVLIKTPQRTELVVSGAETTISYDPRDGKEFWRVKGVESHAIPSPLVGHGMVFLSAGSQAKRAMAVKLGGNGDLTNTPFIVWEYAKGTAYVPSPILYEDFLYLMTDRGILTCLDAKTGQVKYEGGRVPVPATFTASPVAFDGMIFLTSEDGETFVLKSGPKLEVLRTNSVGEPVYASPAIANGNIYIRGEKNLYCISEGSGK
ncbi:MAG TPA: PQQ-binding-like beta-propeller repeat protein [Blastocatellia bacterium]|nr:PQQ-binding-like beta-propeller repeat protein [Blastocatellia bacterium]